MRGGLHKIRTLILVLTITCASAAQSGPAAAEPLTPASCDNGRRALLAKSYETALQNYQDCLAENGLDKDMRFEANINSGDALIQLKRHQEAEKFLREAVRLAPDYSVSTIALATVLGEQGRFQDGLDLLERFAQLHDVAGNTVFFARRGWLRVSTGSYKDAIPDLNAAIRLGPERAYVYGNRGHALAMLGHFRAAYDDLEAAIALDPSDARLYAYYGHYLGLQGRFEEAIGKLDRALELHPTDLDSLIERGNAKSELGDLRGAIADYSRVAEIDPEEEWAYANRANALQLLGDPEEAMKDLERALAIAPDNVNALGLRGELLSNQGRYEEARESLEAALAIDADNSYSLHTYGGVLYSLGHWDKSLEAYDRALSSDPSNSFHRAARGYLRLRLGNTGAALEDFDMALADDPDVFQFYLYRAHALAWADRGFDAAKDIDSALALMNNDEASWHSNEICWDLLLQARTDLAEPLCKRAVDVSDDAPAHSSHAFLDWQRGHMEASETHLSKAFELSGGDSAFDPSRRLEAFPTILAQGLLMYLGYRPDEPDVANTEKTRQAIEAFQRDHGLPVTGEVTEALLTALKAAKP
ncbi:tetratricopeptide repeat protein [Pelagibius sp.]|uniref:tetratricopeptide repeat protein n=1 Tax=Pelagibius sp. TaxID=1931238 RepID=UPI003B50FEBD